MRSVVKALFEEENAFLRAELAAVRAENATLRSDLADAKRTIDKLIAGALATEDAGFALVGQLAKNLEGLQAEIDDSDLELASKDERIARRDERITQLHIEMLRRPAPPQ